METLTLAVEHNIDSGIDFPHDYDIIQKVLSRFEPTLQNVEIIDDISQSAIEVTVEVDPSRLSREQQLGYVRAELSAIAERKVNSMAWWRKQAKAIHMQNDGDARRLRNQVEPLMIQRVHEFQVGNEQSEDRLYQVIEIGKDSQQTLTDGELDAIQAALSMADQFTGGAIGLDPDMRRIVISTDDAVNDDNLRCGFANEAGVVLYRNAIYRYAARENIDPGHLLSIVTTHEVLGHQADRLATGETLDSFEAYFDYSEEAVMPKDKNAISSGVVREYGLENSAEDMATATESIVSRAMEIDQAIAHSDRLATTPDSYRDEKLMTIFDKLAKSTHQSNHQATGYAGARIVSHETPDGTRYVNGQAMEHRLVDQQLFIDGEVSQLVDKIVEQLNSVKFRLEPLFF